MMEETCSLFGKPFKQAEEAFGVLAKSNFISKWVKENIKGTPLTHGLIHLFGKSLAIGAAPVAGLVQSAKLLYRIKNSPTLAKIYSNAMAAAAKEDSIVFNKYVKELDKNLQKEESKEKWEFLD